MEHLSLSAKLVQFLLSCFLWMFACFYEYLR
uniref:Uncharacterized protein n=1 Tax=Rhizophora mucronata TaxID=61149 RepID=A0A2P2Q5A3_RHIMU